MGMEGLHNSQKYRVQVWKSHRTHRRSGNGYGRHTYLTEVPGTGMEVIPNSQKFRVGKPI